MRNAFNAFLKEPLERARAKRIRWQVIPSQSRSQTYRNFCNALVDHPQAINLLLVDAEAPVKTFGAVRQHLKERRGNQWENPGAGDDRCHPWFA